MNHIVISWINFCHHLFQGPENLVTVSTINFPICRKIWCLLHNFHHIVLLTTYYSNNIFLPFVHTVHLYICIQLLHHQAAEWDPAAGVHQEGAWRGRAHWRAPAGRAAPHLRRLRTQETRRYAQTGQENLQGTHPLTLILSNFCHPIVFMLL